MLIAISLYSLGTLILVPDSNPSSPRAMEEDRLGGVFRSPEGARECTRWV
jgi:hypothetical protein